MSYPMEIEDFNDWLATGERGLSSQAIVNQLTGIHITGRPFTGWEYPLDAGDFRRCERLLRAVPEARQHLGLMSAGSPMWAVLVPVWDELIALGEADVPELFGDEFPWGGSATKLWHRMEELFEGVAL